jgi:general secretion pathway protein J
MMLARSINARVSRGRSRGFTLLELLVAIGLMAVLAILCWRGLDSVLRSRDRISSASDELRALTVAYTQMEDDLRRSWSVRLFNLSTPAIGFSSTAPDAPVTLELLRETSSIDEALRVQRVIYRLRDGFLERGFGPWSIPSADGSQAVADKPMTWQPLLADVAGVDVRVYVEPQRGWVDANALVGPVGTVASGQTITGIEYALARRRGGRIVRMFSVKD